MSGTEARFFISVKIGGTVIAHPGRRSHQINGEIEHSQVRLIDEEGNMLGVVPIETALARAEQVNLDLVLVSPAASNPVTKIMDYGKFVFEQEKRQREARKNQKTVAVKEVQIKLTTDTHDLNVKIRNAKRFLKAGDRVKVVIRFRGREMTFQEQGYEVMKNFAEACTAEGTVERPARGEGRNMIMYLAPHNE